MTKTFKIILIIWVIIWMHFIVRQFVKDRTLFGKYVRLVSSDSETKRSIVYGEYFYKFLKFCKDSIPEGSTYQIVGVQTDSVDLPRMIYYLYPSLQSNNPDFILVYKEPSFSKKDYYVYSSLDNESFILRRRK